MIFFSKANIKLFLLTTLFLLIFFKCKDKEDRVPYAPVDIYINLYSPEFNDLNVAGNSVMITGGVRGIIIYRSSEYEFIALERNCTYQPSNECASVEPLDMSSPIAIDSCCGSKFLLQDGSVIKGPASLPLVQYQTSYNGSTLYIHN